MLQHCLFCLLIYLTIKVHMTEQSIIDLLTLEKKTLKDRWIILPLVKSAFSFPKCKQLMIQMFT